MGDAVAAEIAATDYHTAGEPFRIVTAGVPPIAGATVPRAPRARGRVRARSTTVRRLLCHEPRGHADMYGCFLVAPDDDGADLGVLFWHKDGYSTACGHGTIALGAWAVESGAVRRAARRRGRRDDRRAVRPRRRARARCAAGPSTSVAFRNVPSFVVARDVQAAGVAVDVSYGGAIYASVPASRFGPARRPRRPARAHRRRPRGQAGARGHRASRATPSDERLSGIYGTILYEDVGPLHQRNVTIFADGEVDRSPCGSGTSARCALLAADGPARRGRRPAPRLDRRLDLPRARGRVGRPTACSPRSRGRPTAPASTASSSTRATRWAPASSCDEPALPRRGATSPQRLGPTAAIDALEAALLAGLDPEADPPRSALAVGGGELLVMPSATAAPRGGQARDRRRRAAHPGRLRGLRRDHARAGRARRRHRAHQRAHAGGLGARGARARARPTRAVCSSSAAARRPTATSRRSAPCARSSTSTWSAATPSGVDALVAAADIVCCATTAREPLFDGSLVADHATVVAIGSHEPDAREVDDALAAPGDGGGRVAHVGAARGGRRHRGHRRPARCARTSS